MRRALHEHGGRLDIVEPHFLGAGDVDEHAARAVDRGLHQRAGNGHLRGILRLVLAGGTAHAHVRETGALHNGGHVGKVEVDEAGVLDELGNAAHGLDENVVRDLESVGQRNLLGAGVFQTVVRDDEEAVHAAHQLADALLRLQRAAAALPGERTRHNADGEDAGILRGLSHDGSRSRAGAAAHTGGEEYHIGTLERLGDGVAALLGGALSDIGVGARALAVRQLFADLDGLLRAGNSESLFIGIDRDELHALRIAGRHAVDNIVAGAADADDFDGDNVLRVFGDCHSIYPPGSYLGFILILLSFYNVFNRRSTALC